MSDSRYTIQAAEQCTDLDVRTFANPINVVDFLQDQLNDLQISQVAFDHNHVTVATLQKWTDTWENIELLPVDDPVDELRMIKTPDEVDRIRAACRITDDVLDVLVEKTRPGVTERELLWEFEDFLRKQGATVAFDPIIVSGPRTARPHGDPGERALEAGDFITFDLGAKLDGYCSDITRTFVLGPASDRQREVYEHLLKAQVACIEAVRPGAQGQEIDALARQILDEKDLAQYFGHGLGHGLGALVHDTGRLSPIFEQEIKAGQVWTIEPGVYIEGFGGARIEDDVLVTEDGVEILTSFPKELIEIPL